MGPAGPAGPPGSGAPGPQGPAGPPGNGAYAEDEPGFAGFTVATFNGNIGGRPAAHAACAAEFPGGHLCHAAEYLLSNPSGAIPASGAWMDSSVAWDSNVTLQGSTTFGRNTGYSCTSFTQSMSGYNGTYLSPSGAPTYGSTNVCNATRPLACCNGAPKHVLAGYSAQSYTGNIGGRAAAHGICDTEFSGAHMCHASEYLRTVSATPVPAAGVWIDASVDPNGGVALQGGPAFGRNTGYSCTSFTQDMSGYNGSYVAASGAPTYGSTNICNTTRRIACCY